MTGRWTPHQLASAERAFQILLATTGWNCNVSSLRRCLDCESPSLGTALKQAVGSGPPFDLEPTEEQTRSLRRALADLGTP